MNNTILETTIKKNTCIGCGICKSVCPVSAIKMLYTETKEFVPKIKRDICINCGICSQFCPNTYESLKKEAKKIGLSHDPESYGLKKENDFFVGYDLELKNRIKSASGGLVTLLLEELFEKNFIEYVIHAEMIEGKIGDVHYKVSLSKNKDEINQKRSSFYFPIEFSEVIEMFKKESNKIAVTGVPCVIRGMKKLFNEHKDYNKNKVYFISLPCSHNVSGQFIDYLAESLKIKKDVLFKVNLRGKNKNMRNSNEYINKFSFKEEKYIEINRFESIFTDIWRNYYFALNSCLYCSDFWGYEGDISIKDAWGKWTKEPYGISMVVSRNKFLTKLLLESKKANLKRITYEEVKFSQRETVIFKQKYTIEKFLLQKGAYFFKRIKFYSKSEMAEHSKKYYLKYDFETANKKVKKIKRKVIIIENILNLPINLYKLIIKILKKVGIR